LYYQPVPPSPEELALKHLLDQIYTDYPFYGSRRMVIALKPYGWEVNRKRVQHYMREMGIEGIHPPRNLSKAIQAAHRFPYLLRNIHIVRPNQVWGIDITYIRLRHGWMYLVAILDWFSRYVVSWELDQTLEMPFVVEGVSRALKTATPEILNSDQGSHFTSPQYLKLVQDSGAKVSMDGRGRAMDNIFTERLWRSLKYEEVYLKDYDSPREARIGIANYMAFYNQKRPHQSLAYKTPETVYHSTS